MKPRLIIRWHYLFVYPSTCHTVSVCRFVVVEWLQQTLREKKTLRWNRGWSSDDIVCLSLSLSVRLSVTLCLSVGVSLSSDFIAGFCGETEADHQMTLDLIRRVNFNFVFCFPYSMRQVGQPHRCWLTGSLHLLSVWSCSVFVWADMFKFVLVTLLSEY